MLSAGMCVVNLTKRPRVATVPTSGDLAVTTLAEANMDITQLKDWIAVVTGCFAMVGGWIALVTYRGNLRLKRAEWLEKLHSKFYESPNYKRIRRILDYRCEPDYENLQQAIRGTKEDDDLSECFVDYLNFFEYIASLWKLRQLSQVEILMLFDYYMRQLNNHDFVWWFLHEQGFENLVLLMGKIVAEDAEGGTGRIPPTSDRVFVYGTLRNDPNHEMYRVLARDSRYVGTGTIHGELYDLGAYPGVLLAENGQKVVTGEVYELEAKNVTQTWRKLDEYEGCGISDPEPREYERRLVRVELEEGTETEAWAYVLRTMPNEGALIPSGDYLEWRRRNKGR
jgi:gamma-glutamylcyclotransferase (GGCT)/AIG2-like uncharacterized protein YtfP